MKDVLILGIGMGCFVIAMLIPFGIFYFVVGLIEHIFDAIADWRDDEKRSKER